MRDKTAKGLIHEAYNWSHYQLKSLLGNEFVNVVEINQTGNIKNEFNVANVYKSLNFQRLIQRRQHRRHQKMRIYQRNAQSINNQESLDRIANLPRQEISNTLLDQFFNGTAFI
ncbi:1276_t:CDS:2 [Funneliformis geosporum]|uniref:1276_t:CDS:1 n=1 Tax=Funneliformis geosporum TaxID=1117311 RepID=A0A9W4SXS9_9GLOM|nr:1276_t:CDS:2 [Funneliformis geosporum]